MAYHLSLTATEVEQIAKQYGIEPLEFEPIEGGWGNSSFSVQSSSARYVLTVFDTLSPARVEDLGLLLEMLAQHNFPSSRTLPKLAGGYSLIHRDKPILIKEFVTGSVVDRLDAKQLGQAGETLAQLHRLRPPESLQRGHSFDLEFYPLVIERNQSGDFERWLRSCRSDFEKSLAPDLPTGLIHGDLFSDNLLFEGPRLAAIIDFEEACEHVLIFDLGMAAIGLASEQSNLRMDCLEHLVAGYQRVRNLHRCEQEALRSSIIYAAVSTACWRYWKYCIDDPSLGLEDRYLEMVKLAETLMGIGNDRFTEDLFGTRKSPVRHDP